MRKKVIGVLMLTALMAIGTIDVEALETEETEFSDGISSEEDEGEELFDDSEKNDGFDSGEDIDNVDDIPNASDINGYKTNKIELNKYYNISELIDSWGYCLELNIPEDGRIKIRIEDCNVDKIDLSHYLIPVETGATYYDHREWDVIGVDSVDSGWITVQKGSYIPRFYKKNGYNQTINREAKLIVDYQKKGEFSGEIESNDTFDDATLLQNNITYEGNYSKENDVDYYKFCMDNPGKVKIFTENKSEYTPFYWLYEEDENGNVYEIKNINKMGIRLGAGNYYIMIKPYKWCQESTYSVCVNVDYESADAYEQEPNNVKSMANEKQMNTWYTGNLNTKDDIDYYRFVVDKSGKAKLELKVPRQSSNTVLVTLYDENLKKLETLENNSNPYIATEEKKYPKGIYYVRVESGNDGNLFEPDYSICFSQEEYKYVKQIILPDSLTINAGKKYTLTPQILPSDAANPKLTWSSSDSSVATVNSSGVISAKRAGTAIITAKSVDGSEVEGSVKVSVEAAKIDISNVKIILDSAYSYNGKAVKPDFSIEIGNEELVKDQDYTVSYENNSEIGTALMVVTGIGNYTGTIEESFDIVPQDVKIISVKTAGKKKLKVSWKKVSGVDGYILYRSTSKYGDYKQIKIIKNSKTVSYTNTSLKDGKKYYYMVGAYKIIDDEVFSSQNCVPKGNKILGTAQKVNVTGTYRGSATITVYKSGNNYYAKAYGRGGKMNTTVRLYSYSGGYKAYYSGSSDVFFMISNISSSKAKITFPYVSEFNGWYSR